MVSREQEVFNVIQPLLEGFTEGLYWDFKEEMSDASEIIKDVLAFSNSSYAGDSYIIVGVSESTSRRSHKLQLSTRDRQRLNTDANFLYLPAKYDIHGLSGKNLEKIKTLSAALTQKIVSSMLISMPELEFIPIQIKAKRWLYVIVVKRVPGVFISSKDFENSSSKTVVRQGVLYVRMADTTMGAGNGNIATAGEHIRVWKEYIDHLNQQSISTQKQRSEIHE